MAKFYGAIGYASEAETSPGVWDGMVEKSYYGDILRNVRKLENGQQANDDISVSKLVSIVADPYASQHFFEIRYVRWMGTTWKVTNVEVQRPRLILTLGGIYDGSTASTP